MSACRCGSACCWCITRFGVNLRRAHQDRRGVQVITAFDIARMMALGADWCNSGRGFMMALGRIQVYGHAIPAPAPQA